jgi:hypothetical protein
MATEAGRPQPDGEPVVTAGGDLRGASGPGRRDPEQSALVVGERDHEQAMLFVLARVVLPVLRPGTPPGGVNKAVRALDGVVVFHHTKLNCRLGPAGYASLPAR